MTTLNQVTPITIPDLPTGTALTGNEATAVSQAGATVQIPISQYPQGMTAGVVTFGNTGGSPFPNYRTLKAGEGIALTDAGQQSDLTISLAPGGSNAPATASYVVMSSSAVLDHERVLAVGASLSLTDGGANSTATIGTQALTGAITSAANSSATSLGSFTSAQLATALTDETGSGANVFATSPSLITPILGVPTSGNLSNCTALPINTGISGLGAGISTFLTTPSSANLASAITDETGSGVLVFATSPSLVTPNVGVATATSVTVNGTGLASPVSVTFDGVNGTNAYNVIFPAMANSNASNNWKGFNTSTSSISGGSQLNDIYGVEVQKVTASGTSFFSSFRGVYVQQPTITSTSSSFSGIMGLRIDGASVMGSANPNISILGVDIGAPTLSGTTSSVSASTGVNIANQGGAGATNSFGINIAAQSGASSNSWSIFCSSGFRVNGNGNTAINSSTIATTATLGFLAIPTGSGTPIGVPVSQYTNAASLYYDYTNDRIWIYNSSKSAWKMTAVLT